MKFNSIILSMLLTTQIGIAMESERLETVEILPLDVISYEQFIQNDPEALQIVDRALHEKGIVGIRGVPGYREKFAQFIKAARAFNVLPEEVKETYKPNHALGETFLGYEMGKEQFKRPDGRWVVDDLKVSYYGFIPNISPNKWPLEVDLQGPFQELGALMSQMGEAVMWAIGLLGPRTGISIEGKSRVGRMLYYRKSSDTENPFWCGAHFDHGLFTTILPAVYFSGEELIEEPLEAGIFVRTSSDVPFQKVVANDLDVMMFQVGEFGQLVSNDSIRATEHRVHKSSKPIERYTMAVFFEPHLETIIHSDSVLTSDARYGAEKGAPCSYQRWHEASFERYTVKK